MNDLIEVSGATLPMLIDRAALALTSARTSAEVLEARDMAKAAYDATKSAGRMARHKKAHDEVIAAVYRAQADALLIEARAKMRLADEYDAAQDRGEVASLGTNQHRQEGVADANTLGIRRDEIHEARKLRDAEQADPGKIERTLKGMAERGEEPTKAKLRQEIEAEAPKEQADQTPEDRIAAKIRREFRKLTKDAQEDEFVAIRLALRDEKAKRKKAEEKADGLKEKLTNREADDKDAVIGGLERQIAHLHSEMFRANEKARVAIVSARKAQDEAKALRKSIEAQVIPL
jgi:uncharacterized DUF497 family protein